MCWGSEGPTERVAEETRGQGAHWGKGAPGGGNGRHRGVRQERTRLGHGPSSGAPAGTGSCLQGGKGVAPRRPAALRAPGGLQTGWACSGQGAPGHWPRQAQGQDTGIPAKP